MQWSVSSWGVSCVVLWGIDKSKANIIIIITMINGIVIFCVDRAYKISSPFTPPHGFGLNKVDAAIIFLV